MGEAEGNHSLDVLFDNSVIRVPVDMMAEEQARQFEKEWILGSRRKDR